MPFKKLIPSLKTALTRLGFNEPLPFQQQILSKIKGGANVFGIAPEGSGKTTAMIISVIQKLKGMEIGDSPRAIIFVKDKKAALLLKEKFDKFTQRTSLRVYCLYDEYRIDFQKEDIYYGTDVVITTPSRLTKLYNMNGIHLGQLQLFVVEDASLLDKRSSLPEINRITESIDKCQYLVFNDVMDAKTERFKDSFMQNSQAVIIEK